MPILWTRSWQDQLPPAAQRTSIDKVWLIIAEYFLQESYEPLTQDIQAILDFLKLHSLSIPPRQILIHAWLCGIVNLLVFNT